MNVCSVHGDAHHWEEERVEAGVVHQRCACGVGRAFREEPETAVEEEARLLAESGAHAANVAARVADIENEGIGDSLHGALLILLDPTLVPEERRATEIVNHVFRVIAQRDLAQPERAADLTHVDRVEIIDRTGRAFVRRYEVAGASLSVQDDGRTLKVFADGRAA